MKITNSAISENFSEKYLTVQKLSNGNFKVTAVEERIAIGKGKRETSIDMTFNPNQFAAIVGSWMAIEHGGNK